MMKGRNMRRGIALWPALWMVTALVVGVATSPVVAGDGDHKRHRGYVDGSAFAKLANEDSTLIEVSINGPLLRTVAAALAKENEGIGEFLGGIVSISAVVVEDADDDNGSMASIAAKIAEDLKEDGWEQIARVRERGEGVTVLVLLDDKNEDSLAGVTVMVNEDDDNMVFANIAGRINLSMVAKLAAGLGVPGLEELSNLDLGDAVKKSKGKKRDRK